MDSRDISFRPVTGSTRDPYPNNASVATLDTRPCAYQAEDDLFVFNKKVTGQARTRDRTMQKARFLEKGVCAR